MFLHHRSEGLTECRVALHKQLLMGQLVKDQARHVSLAPGQHGIEHGVCEIAQGGIGGDAANERVQPPLVQPLGKALRRGLFEKAAITQATHEKETPPRRFNGELFRRHHVPNYEAPVKISVAAIAVVVRQSQLGGRKIPNPLHLSQLPHQLRIRVLTSQNGVDRCALAQ